MALSQPPTSNAQGPLCGLRVIEMVGLGPAPFCGMMLADMGAEVIRIAQKRKPGVVAPFAFAVPEHDILARGRASIAIDLKTVQGHEIALNLIAQADALIEGFRPGVMERLNLSPESCMKLNPRLVYGRMTGWGQTGPLSQAAGHDINYVALTGALWGIGPADQPPVVPLNLLGDFGGGAMMLAFGVVCALLEARTSGKGQVIDAAIVDGTALLSAMIHSFKAAGRWKEERASNMLDGGAPYYRTYRCSDDRFIALGALEPQFYGQLCKLLGVEESPLPARTDPAAWSALHERFAAIFISRTREQWCELLEGTDACFAPVLSWDEAPDHAHNAEREIYVRVAGVRQPSPAPRFSRTPGAIQRAASADGADTESILLRCGYDRDTIESLAAAGVI
jgi:alpha-methylacyl-CoA racemase